MDAQFRNYHFATSAVVAIEENVPSNQEKGHLLYTNEIVASSSTQSLAGVQASTFPTEHDATYHLSSRVKQVALCRAQHPLKPFYKCEAYIWAEYVAMTKLPAADAGYTGRRVTKTAEQRALIECLGNAKGNSRPGVCTPAA